MAASRPSVSVDVDDPRGRAHWPQRRAEPHLTFLLAAEEAAAERDQHGPRAAPSHWLIRYAAVAPAARLSMPT